MKQYLSKFKKQTNFTTQIIAMVALVLIVNLLSYQVFWRWDVTANNAYSLSQTSIDLMRELDDVVNVTVYASEALPPQLFTVRQAISDTLRDYQAYANGNLAIDYIDPAGDDDLRQELLFTGIPEIQFNVMSNNKYEVSSGYLGIQVTYADNQEVIPFVQNPANLELQLTTAIAKAVDDTVPAIGFASGQGEYTLANDFTLLQQGLGTAYAVEEMNLDEIDAIPEGLDALVLAGAKEEYTEAQRYAIDQFVMRGGSLFVLQSGVNVDLDTLSASAAETNVNQIIEPYGIATNQSFVLDTQLEPGRFNGGGGQSVVLPYPFFVMAAENSFNKENPIVAQLQQVVLPWTSPLSITQDSEDIAVLAHTTTDAWIMANNFNLNPQGDFAFQEDPERYALAALRTGTMQSGFENKPEGIEIAGEHIGETSEGAVFVVGGSRFLTDTFLQNYPQNGVFFQNALDFLVSPRNLIAIRAKQIENRPLTGLESAHYSSDSKKAWITYLNVYGVTALVLLFGISRYLLRKRRNT